MFTLGCAAVPPPDHKIVTPLATGGDSRLPMFVHVKFAGNSVDALNAAISGPAALDSVHVPGPSSAGLADPIMLTHRYPEPGSPLPARSMPCRAPPGPVRSREAPGCSSFEPMLVKSEGIGAPEVGSES